MTKLVPHLGQFQEIVPVEVPAVGHKQTAPETRGLWQRGPLARGVGRQGHLGKRFVQEVQGRMQFDCRGLHLLEPSRKDLFQGVLDREGTAILDDDPAKLREGASRRHAEHSITSVSKSPRAVSRMNTANSRLASWS